MADVFISYSSRNRREAAALAAALGGAGLTVWWDREILTGEAFDRAIERELEAARSVVVLWSDESVESEWVKNEAAAAAERGVLLPANLDGVRLPLEFRRRQTVDLSGWSGDIAHEGFQALQRDIRRLLGQPPTSVRAAGTVPASAGASGPAPVVAGRRGTRVALGLALGLLIAMLVLYFGPWTRGLAPSGPVAPAATDGSGAVNGGTRQASLADKVAGTYLGAVVSDSKGSSRSDISVTLQALASNRVRASSGYERIGSVDIELTQIGTQVLSVGGDSTLIVDLGVTPPTLLLNPRGELAFHGARQP